MGLKNLLNADTLMQNHNNKITGEHVKNIILNENYFVAHSIYFAETLRVFKDEAKTQQLVEGADYIFSEIDSIASEMSNKDCYRAVVFLTPITDAYIDYWSYGDIISAETLNDLIIGINSGSEALNELNQGLETLNNNFISHSQNKAAHGASVSPQKNTLALRNDKGIIKTATPQEFNDAVNLGSQTQAIQTVKTELQDSINEARTEILNEIDIVDKRLKIKEPVLKVEDFYPEGFDPLSATPEELEEVNQNATIALNALTESTQNYHNVVRNKNASITVPEAVDDTDAINKQTLIATINSRIAELINNAPEELDTLKELADALQNNETAIAAINTALANRYTKEECDNKFLQKAQFTLTGTTLEINF